MFPKDFLWGSATSSHQVEGHNANNDWWLWEKGGRVKERSGDAARQYELFDDDFALAQKLSHNAHRFSIEWSRVEPREGEFNETEVDHYRRVLDSLLGRSLIPVVTLHHFTSPQWFVREGGWLDPKAAQRFSRYVRKMAEVFKDKVRYWVTINEPLVLAYNGYLIGQWPPGEKSFWTAWRMIHRCLKAHHQAYRDIHAAYSSSQKPLVGIAHNLRPFAACPVKSNILCAIHARLRHYLFNMYFLERSEKTTDFIGVNYYEREFISHDSQNKLGLLGDNCNLAHRHSDHVNQMGWGLFPEGLSEVLRWLKKYNKPILITENGTAEDDDRDRAHFIIAHLKEVESAIAEGIPVKGYFYWSLIDNFEWDKGFDRRFGLVEVDYKTFERRMRPSAYILKEIIERRALP